MNGIHNHRNTCGIVVCKWISFGIAFCCCILLTSFVGPSLFADLEGAAKDASVIKIPFLLTTIVYKRNGRNIFFRVPRG